MYGTTAYYLAMATSMTTLFIIYPIIVSLTAFWFYKFEEHSFSDMLEWMRILILAACAGGFWGFGFGTLFKSEVAATQMHTLFVIIFSLCAGLYANSGDD